MTDRVPLYLDSSHIPREMTSGDTIAGVQPSTTRATVSVTSSSGAAQAGTIIMGKQVVLLSMSSDNPCRIRLYTRVAGQVADQSRALGEYPNPLLNSGLLFEGVTVNSLLSFDIDSCDAFNNETTVTTAIAYYIQPTNAVSTTVTFKYSVRE